MEYAVVSLVSGTTGAIIMNVIKNYFKNRREKQIIRRIRNFKYCHNLFWTKFFIDGTVEFWAHSCISDESWYLGIFDGDDIKECDGFYHHTLPWSVQKGALRLFDHFKRDQDMII